jgi:hypothetical protein
MRNFQEQREVITNMIEKKITYNEPKPTKVSNIKPVSQGGKLNYLGKQKTITAPVKWKSGPTHPETHLAYITKQEQDILVKLDLYKSMNGKPNKGPFGLPSLNDGDGSGGGGSGSDGAGAGDSGGSGGGASASGGGGDDGAGASSAGDAGASTGDSGGVGGSGDSTSGGGVGSGPGGEEGTGGVSASTSTTGVSDAVSKAVDTVTSFGRQAIANAISNPVSTAIGMVAGPVAGMAARGIAAAVDAANRGVTGPSDDTQESTSVQSGPSQSPSGGGGIGTIQAYAPVYNPDTGNPTMDAYMRRLRVNLGLPV